MLFLLLDLLIEYRQIRYYFTRSISSQLSHEHDGAYRSTSIPRVLDECKPGRDYLPSVQMPLTAHVLFGDIKFNIARFRGSLVAGTHLQIRRSRTQSSSGVVVVRACPCTLMRS